VVQVSDGWSWIWIRGELGLAQREQGALAGTSKGKLSCSYLAGEEYGVLLGETSTPTAASTQWTRMRRHVVEIDD
jgi:hypothetical protein